MFKRSLIALAVITSAAPSIAMEECIDPQDPMCVDEGGGDGGFGPTYAVTGADVTTTESTSIIIGDDETLYEGVPNNPTYEIISQPA